MPKPTISTEPMTRLRTRRDSSPTSERSFCNRTPWRFFSASSGASTLLRAGTVRSARNTNASAFLPSRISATFSVATLRNSAISGGIGAYASRPACVIIARPNSSSRCSTSRTLSATSASEAFISSGVRARIAWRSCSEARVTLSSSSPIRCSCGTRATPTISACEVIWPIITHTRAATPTIATTSVTLIAKRRWARLNPVVVVIVVLFLSGARTAWRGARCQNSRHGR